MYAVNNITYNECSHINQRILDQLVNREVFCCVTQEIEFMIKHAYEGDDDNISSLLDAMRLVEDNYLGGSGSRGFGQIKFENIKLTKRTADYYKENNAEDVIIESDEITEVINAIK